MSKDEIQAVILKNHGQHVWLERVAANDGRLCLMNDDGALCMWWNAEFDEQEQAQAARVCGAINELWAANRRADKRRTS